MPFTTADFVRRPLYVILPVFDPVRWRRRWLLYDVVARNIKAAGGVVVTIEASFGERHHALDEGVTQHGTIIHQAAPEKPTEFFKTHGVDDHIFIKVQTDSELWLKENLINIAISRLPREAEYIAWVDADVAFSNYKWVGEAVHQLQHYAFIQLFSHALDLGPKFEPMDTHLGFAYCFRNGIEPNKDQPWGYYGKRGLPGKPREFRWHPGYCWAARRDAIDAVGGLPDFAILGAADNHVAHALIGAGEASVHPGMHPNYLKRVKEWQWRVNNESVAGKRIRDNIGYVNGLLLHYWHGKKKNRKYWDRWQILVDNQYDPDIDIKYGSQGVLQLADRYELRSIALRDQLRAYNRQRDEDSIDV